MPHLDEWFLAKEVQRTSAPSNLQGESSAMLPLPNRKSTSEVQKQHQVDADALRIVEEKLTKGSQLVEKEAVINAVPSMLGGNELRERRDAMIAEQLSAAGLPLDYEPSPAMIQLLDHQATNLLRTLQHYETSKDPRTQQDYLNDFVQFTRTYSHQVLEKYLEERLLPQDYQRIVERRVNAKPGTVDLTVAAATLEVAKWLHLGNKYEAYRAALKYFKVHVAGCSSVYSTANIIVEEEMQKLAHAFTTTVEHLALPVILEQVKKHRSQGFWSSLGSSAYGTLAFFGNLIASPFSTSSRKEIEGSIEPLVSMKWNGGYNQLVPLARDMATIAGVDALDKCDVMALIRTLAGSLAITVGTMCMSGGMSVGAKVGEAAGLSSTAITTLQKGASTINAMRKLRTVASPAVTGGNAMKAMHALH